MKLLRPPTLERDGCELRSFPNILTADFQAVQQAAYAKLQRGQNSTNELRRGIGWGVYINDRFIWTERHTYSLPVEFNPEEKGRTRTFVRLDSEFLENPDFEAALRDCFNAWEFEESSTDRAYEVQLSAIRYEPTLDRPAFPAPIIPHQDLIDGTVIVLQKVGCLTGGETRIYSLDNDPLFEFNLEASEGIFIRDAEVKHQVTTLQLAPNSSWRAGCRAYRDIIIVRFQPLGR